MEKKKRKWLKFRHRVVRQVGVMFLWPWAKCLLGADVKPFREQGGRNWLVLANHQTPYDQFFIGMSFRTPVYYLASEDIFEKKWVSAVIRWGVEPIPIVKNTTDLKAVRNCIQVAREGGTIAIFPEGNRTYSGKTEYMNPAIAKMAKMLKLPIALYRIEGGYGMQPRWGDGRRRGKLSASVSRIIEPEEYADLSDGELLAEIRNELAVNDCRDTGNRYRSGKRAQYLERAAYVCPWCGLAVFRSRGNRIRCESCGREVEYGEDLRLKGAGCEFPFEWYTEWYDWQNAFVRKLDIGAYTETPAFRDEVDLYRVILGRGRNLLREKAAFALYGDRITVGGDGAEPLLLSFREITAATALGKNKLNLYLGETVYQVKGGPRFNALKYVNFYYRYRILAGDAKDGEFLGL